MKSIKLLILFGSKASESSHKDSDVDIAVLADHALTLNEKMNLAEKMANQFEVNEGKVDIVDLWQASPLLQYEIAKNGKVIKGSEFDFLRFQVLAWKRYQDTKKLRQAREKNLETTTNVR